MFFFCIGIFFNKGHKNSNRKQECPQCRKTTTIHTIHPIYLKIEQAGVNEQLILTRISDIADFSDKRDKKLDTTFKTLTDSLEKITVSMSAFEYQNERLKKENADLSNIIKTLENDSKQNVVSKNDSSTMKEQMKTKDFVIASLQKEVNDLKAQRADTTREMNTIREQINVLKATAKGERIPLKDKNEQKSQTLTLKFDDFSDKL